MRVYVFCHSFLSGIQKGIQAAHSVAELGHMAGDSGPYVDWVKNHKTLILLEGGSTLDLIKIRDSLYSEDPQNPPYHFAAFHEDADSLNGSMTAVAVSIPNNIAVAIGDYRSERFQYRKKFLRDGGFDEFDSGLIEMVAGYRLASS